MVFTENEKQHENVHSNTPVYFTLSSPSLQMNHEIIIRLFNIIDLSPITVTDHTPMEIVVEIFTKLGIRQALVTHNG